MLEVIVNVFKEYYPLFIEGALMTILLSFLTVLLGSVIGLLISVSRVKKGNVVLKVLNKIVDGYVSFFRGTPLLIQLYLIYFGLPQIFGFRYPDIDLIPYSSKLLPGIIALSLNSGAYVAEIFRAGINAVDHGQMEAGRALGFSENHTLRFIVIPQAIKNILPALGNEFITIIKESSIVSIIGLRELTYAGDIVRAGSYQPFAVLIIVAIIYYLLTTSLSLGLARFEKRLNKYA